MLEETFAAQDERFVDSLKQFDTDQYLATFVQKWLADQRPWARQQVFVYLTGSLNLPGHEVVFKRLYKHFRAAADHEVMAHFMVALDRMVRRQICTAWHYDWSNRTSWSTQAIRAIPNQSFRDIAGSTVTLNNDRGSATEYVLRDQRNKPTNMLFSHKTRNYLRRSVWRYFRLLSYRDPDAYLKAMGRALSLYRDDDFQTGENILDNWSLMHACYYHDENIQFTQSHTNIVDGKSLSNLSPRPYRPAIWGSDTGAQTLVKLLIDARSTLVRIWTIEFFKRAHVDALKQIKLSALIELMSRPDPNLQQFASSLFEEHPDLPTLTVEQWLSLLNETAPELLSVVCDAMRKHVSPDRLDNPQLIQLTCAQQVPVAAFGFELLQQRDKNSALSNQELALLADMQCTTETVNTTPWAMNRISASGDYDVDWVIDFFDALLRPTRNAAMTWLQDTDRQGHDDARLWARLIESPFDDVRIELVNLLERRVLPTTRRGTPKQSSATTDDVKDLDSVMAPVWVSVILGIHRGGRSKPKAMRQLSRQIIAHPDQAEQLLPVLAVALRSIRSPEQLEALATLVELAQHSPQLQTQIQNHFPELDLMVESAEVPQ